jgi:hypothetical protein
MSWKCQSCGMVMEAGKSYGYACPTSDRCSFLPIDPQPRQYLTMPLMSGTRDAEPTARIAALEAALAPFAEFARASNFDLLPLDTPMTQGSRLARKQVTVADFIRARTALEAGQ